MTVRCFASCQHNCQKGCAVSHLVVRDAQKDGHAIGYCQSFAKARLPYFIEKRGEPKLHCNVSCAHNQNGYCQAQYVFMKEDPFSVNCDTFESPAP